MNITTTQQEQCIAYCSRARAAFGGFNPGAIRAREAVEHGLAWASALSRAEQTSAVIMLQAHLHNDVLDMDGRGVSTAMTQEELALWEKHYESVDWARASEIELAQMEAGHA